MELFMFLLTDTFFDVDLECWKQVLFQEGNVFACRTCGISWGQKKYKISK